MPSRYDQHEAEVYELAGLSRNGVEPEEEDTPAPLPKAEPFPVEVMPRSCRRLIEEATACMSCAPDLVALPMLATLSSAIGASRLVEIKRGWREGASLFTAVVAAPGSMKSPAADVAAAPASAAERRNKREYAEEKKEYDKKRRQWEADKREAASNKETAPPEPDPPHMTRCMASDTTVEALVGILEHNPRGLLVFRDELSGWVKSMDQYKTGGKGSDRDHWLSIYSNQEVIVDRKSQNGEPIMLTRPFASVCGGIQPFRLGDLGGAAEDGMMDRFLFSYPDTGHVEDNDEEISERAEKEYAALYDTLSDLTMPTDEYDAPNPKPLRMSEEARGVFRDVVNELSSETARPGFPAHLEGPWAKMRGQLARLSLILAVCRCAEDVVSGEDERIETVDVAKASKLLDYFKSHARRVYGRIRPGAAAKKAEELGESVTEFVKENGENVVGVVGDVGQNGEPPTSPTTPTTNSGFWKWEGKPADLFDALEKKGAGGLPKRANELTQRLMKLSGQSGLLDVERGWQEKNRVLRISYGATPFGESRRE